MDKHACKMTLVGILSGIAKLMTTQMPTSGGDWLNKSWYMQEMEYYVVVKKNKAISYILIWNTLQILLEK